MIGVISKEINAPPMTGFAVFLVLVFLCQCQMNKF